MRDKWIKPDFQEISVNGECTAYAGIRIAEVPRAGGAAESTLRAALPPANTTSNGNALGTGCF